MCPVNLGWLHKAPPKAGSVLLALLAPGLQQGLQQVQRNTCFPKTEDVAEQVLHTGRALFQMGSIPKQHQDLSKQGGARCDTSRQLVKKKGEVKSPNRNV